jgi:hypothetical protein
MALKALKRPKTEFLNQSSEIASPDIPETPLYLRKAQDAAPTVPEPLNLDAPPRRLYMDADREEIIAEILRLECKHIKDGLHYDRVRYLGDNTLNRRKEFLLDYLYSLCDHLENYTIGIHDLAERQAIREYEREVELILRKAQERQQQHPKVEIFPTERAERKHFDFLPQEKAS